MRASPVLARLLQCIWDWTLGRRIISPCQRPAVTTIPTVPYLHLRPSPWGAVTRQRRRPHTPVFYTTTLPFLTPQPCGRKDVSSLTQGWIVPWSMRRSFHVDQPCPCKWGWSVITIPVIFLGPCEVSFLQLTQYLNLIRGARGL